MRLHPARPSRSPAPLPSSAPPPPPATADPRRHAEALAAWTRRLGALALSIFSMAGALGCDGRDPHGGAATAGAPGTPQTPQPPQMTAPETASAAAAAAARPRRGGTLVTGFTAEPSGVNQLIARQTNPQSEMDIQLFLRLVREESDFEQHPPTMSPSLARSYEWSPDHKALTFHLREDARWSDGVPVTADDVRWTWQAEMSPEVGWEFSYMKAEISDVEVVDPHTARFHFKRVYANQLLDVNEGGILPRHAWSKLPFARWRQSADWFRQHLVVDGPFTVESWKPQQEVVLTRNRGYFEPERPYLDRVVLRIIPDQASILTQLESGELGFTSQIAPADAVRVSGNSSLRLLPFWYRTWVGIAWNCARQPFSDPEVRRALSLALDRRAIVETIWGQFARVTESPILAGVWAYDHALQPLPYDPGEARRILKARGYSPGPDGVLRRGGRPFELEISTNSGNQQRVDALVMIQEQLRRIGVKARPQQVEFNTLDSEVRAGRYDATLYGTSMDTSLDLKSQFHSSEIGGGENIVRYSNPEVDRLIEHANSLPDIVQAKPDLERIQEILHRDQPYTFLWESQRLSAMSRRLHGVKPSMLFSFYDLKDWWLAP
jgi:peptide/nickel transport system substrate-binding protein